MAEPFFIDVQNLHIRFDQHGAAGHVVRGVDLRIRPGQVVALVGESGSGKSVTARSMLGLAGRHAKLSADRFEIAGENALSFSEKRWRQVRGAQIGYVLQDALVSLDPLRRIGQLLGDAQGRGASQAQALQLLHDVGMSQPAARLHQYPHELSGGLRQRALIAAAIARSPQLVIADEPTTALDVTVQQQILALLGQRRDAGHGLLLISHDLAVVAQLADEVLVLRHGEVVEQGPTQQVLQAPSHPYTQQLLDAIPSAHTKGYRLARTAVQEALVAPPALSIVSAASTTSEAPAAQSAAPQQVALAAVSREPLPAKAIQRDRVVLSVRNVHKHYASSQTGPAVQDVSLQLLQGQALGIVGESGSGKTTLARMVLGLIEPDAGEIVLNGHLWSGVGEAARRPHRAGIQFIAQDPLSSFDPRYNVERLIGESLDTVAIHGAARRQRVLEVLDAVRLPAHFLHRHPRELSGGQRQRVAIARAFAPKPQLLVADEPVSALDVSVQAQVLDLLAELQAESGTALLFISHDLGVVHHLTDAVVVMKEGRVVEQGDVHTVFAAPQHTYTRQLLSAIPALPVPAAVAEPQAQRLIA